MSFAAVAPSTAFAAPSAAASMSVEKLKGFKYTNAIQRPLLDAAAGDEAAFVKFVKNLPAGVDTPEYKELYHFLLECFSEADSDFDGLVGPERFDYMIERAACLPRKYGFAPTEAESFADPQQRQAFRADEFRKINTAGNGQIAFDEWLEWAYCHICLKAQQLNQRTGNDWNENPNSFTNFIVKACGSTTTPEYKEMYQFLQDCFTNADGDRDGRVSVAEFDSMVEIAASAPRKFGFAPPTNQTYSSDAQRMQARQALFQAIDTSRNGYISFNDWMKWSYPHICAKAKTLNPSLSGLPPADAPKTLGGGAQQNMSRQVSAATAGAMNMTLPGRN
jgi:Ca2+-binding EF-hand superfamily protein